MTEKLVDVGENHGSVLHVFPVTIGGETAPDAAFEKKALECAANAALVPRQKLGNLTTRMHVDRGGPLEPYGDSLAVLAETREGLDKIVREEAYLLWEKAGRPQSRSDEFWQGAQHQHFCERAYALWEREGRPHEMADEHWCRVRDFEQG